jgi:preprotein translocase subunit SecA
MLNRLVRLFAGDPSKRTIDKYSTIVDQINSLEPQFEALSDEDLAAKTIEFRHRLAAGETLDDLLPAAFAAVREASKRYPGLRHYDVQLIGGMVLHQGTIAEMRTGRGQDAGRHSAAVSECTDRTRRAFDYSERLPGPARCALDGAYLPCSA